MASFFQRFANPRGNSRSTTALRGSLIRTLLTGMEKSCESFSHPNSGIRRICWHISMPSSDKPKNETQEKSNAETQRTQRKRRAEAEQCSSASCGIDFRCEPRVSARTFLGDLLLLRKYLQAV